MPRSPDDRRRALRAGADAEERVASLLAADGWSVLARNWRGGGGELDVVVARGVAVRFVEVKLRDPADPLGDEAVSASKRSRLRSAATRGPRSPPRSVGPSGMRGAAASVAASAASSAYSALSRA